LQLTHALTSIRHVNKTDVVTLGSSFGVSWTKDYFDLKSLSFHIQYNCLTMYYVLALSYGSNLATKYAENVFALNLFFTFSVTLTSYECFYGRAGSLPRDW
jgi:hypothetical protein